MIWTQWTNVILGIIVAIVPFLNLTAVAFTWTLVVVGIAVVALGIWGAQEASSAKDRGRMEYRERRT